MGVHWYLVDHEKRVYFDVAKGVHDVLESKETCEVCCCRLARASIVVGDDAEERLTAEFVKSWEEDGLLTVEEREQLRRRAAGIVWFLRGRGPTCLHNDASWDNDEEYEEVEHFVKSRDGIQ